MYVTMGPINLVPSVMVLDALPSLLMIITDYPNRAEVMKALRIARKEMAAALAESRTFMALLSQLSPSARYGIDMGDLVSDCREPSWRWDGPFAVESTTKK